MEKQKEETEELEFDYNDEFEPDEEGE